MLQYSRALLFVFVSLLVVRTATAQDAMAAEERVRWIQEQISIVAEGNERDRQAALVRLMQRDKDGDCTTPVIGLLLETKKNTPLLVDLIRALGRDQLAVAAPPIAKHLSHRDEKVRGNAAVSLEYIGSSHKEVVGALKKSAEREKDLSIANHMYRALGRCGIEDKKARALLIKKCGSAKSEFATYGPTIGLAYFEGDEKAARGVEKVLKRIGVPGGRRGGGQNTVKRGLLCWTLASIGDKKSGPFMREELIAKLKNVKAFWVEGLKTFYQMVARKCEGEAGEMAGITAGVGNFAAFARNADLERYGAEVRNLMDDYRIGREAATFRPKGDGLLGKPAGM
ncbi:MAG: hypothetical protein V3T86_18245 [Planctomycetota bacterium]